MRLLVIVIALAALLAVDLLPLLVEQQ